MAQKAVFPAQAEQAAKTRQRSKTLVRFSLFICSLDISDMLRSKRHSQGSHRNTLPDQVRPAQVVGHRKHDRVSSDGRIAMSRAHFAASSTPITKVPFVLDNGSIRIRTAPCIETQGLVAQGRHLTPGEFGFRQGVGADRQREGT